nr:uncharacterized protein LOC107446204 [Parasteatoda tepidariorum]XP_042901401.1 uncharacterized protein LOC107446204 [Parasteatoda tepidariorum]XP_042901404.1 uncharacterized protein LOC107446204 [Parasteatoda tepidariorum]
MAFPYCEKLKVTHLELSNKNFKSTILSHINNSHARSILLDRCIYPSDYQLAEFSSRVYKEGEYLESLEQGWDLLTTGKNQEDGYFGAAYWNPDHQQVVIAHKGTNPKSVNDLWTDYEGILSNEYTSQMSSAVSFADNIAVELEKLNQKQSVNLTLSITGHSLGAWLGQITAFSTKYLTKGEGHFFVKSRKEGFHVHTVVFDSPGCRDMLLKMESDFDVRYSGKAHSSFFLDVSIYLSAPNLVNTLHSHLNVGHLYRLFIENIAHRSSSWDFFQYTMETHNMNSIKKALICSSAKKIMKVIDWPLVKEGLGGIIVKKIFNIFTTNPNEYEHFHELAHCINLYNPPPNGNEYCTLRYQVQSIEKGECSANIFTQSEFEFLNGCHRLKQFSMLSVADHLFLLLVEKSKGVISKDKIEEILQDLTIKEGIGLGIIKHNSEKQLQKLIICVKNILFIFPDIHREISKLKNLAVFEEVYKKQTFNYLKSIQYIELKKATMEYTDFLNNADLKFLQIICKVHPVFGIKKLHKLLMENKLNYEASKSFFLSLKQLLNLEQFFALNEFVKQLDKNAPLLLVVESNNDLWKEDKKILINNFIKILNILKDKQKFKFILFSGEKNDLEYFLGNNDEFYYEMVDNTSLEFHDLTEDSQKILSNKTMYFQGEKTTLNTLITEESKHVVDERSLSKLMNKETIEIGKKLLNLGDMETYYINRIFNQSTIKKDIKNDYKIHITYNDKIQKSSLNREQDIVLISDERAGFDELCKVFENRNIHWLKEVDNQFVWQKSRGALSILRDYIDTENVTEFRDIDGRIVIISAVSGAGKSTVLTKLAQEMKNFDSSLWVVRINLNDYTEIFANNDFIKDKDKIFKFLMNIAGLNTPLEQDLFKYRLNVLGKVAILLDGFDEIVPRYKEKVVELLKAVKHSKVEKLWITSRPHMKDELEDVLSVLSFSLMPLSRNDQVMFMKNMLCNIQKFSIKENFELYANKLLDKVLQSISDKNKEFTGIPLQTKMLIEAFQEKIKTFYDQFNKNESNISIKLDLMNLYRAFVESKYKRHLLEKQILNLSKSGPEYDTLFASFEKKYSLLALCILFHEEDLNQFLIEEELETIKLLKRQIQEGKENSGFISHIVAAKPIFIHFSFAEYFAAHFYSKNIKRKEVTKFFCHQVYGKEHNLTRIFFDQMVTADKHTCKMHIAILNNDIEKVKQLLSNAEKAKDFVNAADKVGRTALHLAAAYGNFYMVKTLLNHEFRVDAKDQLLGWRPLRYADKDGHWETVELLLRKGANARDMCEAIKSLVIYDAQKPKVTLLHEAAAKGLVTILETLIESKINLINVVDESGWSPLHYAADEKVANFLIKFGADIEAKDWSGEAPLQLALRRGNIEVAELLIAKGANINAKENTGITPLHTAVINGKEEVVEFLIKEGADVEARNFNDITPLYFSESKKISELLIAKGADINAKDSDGCTPLHAAVEQGKYEVVELLLKKGADVEAKKFNDITPLFLADSIKISELLIAKGADVNVKSSIGYTPLHAAAVNGKDEVVELLIKKGADVEANDSDDLTPLFFAGSKKISELLIAKGADINAKSSEGFTPLHAAVKNGIDEVVELLIVKGADINAKNNAGITPLHSAVINGKEEVVELLIKEGADVEARDFDDITPLHFAGRKKISELLVAEGADINAKDSEGCTPLHAAAENGKDEVVELLIKEGADVEAKNSNDITPLFLAGSKKISERLIAKGADVNAKCVSGYTPLHAAVENGRDEVVELLIKESADVEAKNSNDVTPLFLASSKKITELLIAKGADVNAKCMSGYTPLHAAVTNGKDEVVELLIKEGADVNAKNLEDETPLFLAGSKQISELLITKGADINAKSSKGGTPLHTATLNERYEVVELLIKAGADIEAKDSDGETPLFAAESKNILELLVAKGADVNAKCMSGYTPLHAAVENGKDEVVELLIKEGADVEAKNTDDLTPLFFASSKKISELLIANGADINAKSSEGYTPLHAAVVIGKDEVVELLIKEGADVNAKNLEDETPLFFADNKQISELLIAKGAYINAKSSEGYTPLHAAVVNGKDEVVELLIKQGADIEAKDCDDETPLFTAESKSISELLIAKGADINAKNSDGYTPLHRAVMNNNVEFVELLVKEGANVSDKDNLGRTPLFYANSKTVLEFIIANGADKVTGIHI